MTRDLPLSARHVSTHEGLAARRLRLAVALTFPLAFIIHDAEEVVAARRWQRNAPALLRDRFPNLPESVVQAVAVSPRRMTNAVGVMSCAVAAITALSLSRLNRPLDLLRPVVAVFGVHSITHLAQAVALRAYTPGVTSAALVVAPYSLWAWRTLNEADAGQGARFAPALLKGGPPALILVVLAHVLAAARERTSESRSRTKGAT